MTLKTFLKTKDKKVKVQVHLQLSSDPTIEEYSVSDVKDSIIGRAHLFDVVNWTVQFDNYEPLVVVTVK
jgi:hypothetical protein